MTDDNITSPSEKGSYRTKDSSVNFSGTASDNIGVIKVTWSNDVTGGSGTANGLDNWSVYGISLADGKNTITITAIDEAGNNGSAQLIVFSK